MSLPLAILLGFLAVVLVLLLCPVRIWLRWEPEERLLRLGYLWWHVILYPPKPKVDQPPEPEPPPSDQAPRKKKKKKEDALTAEQLREGLRLILNLIPRCGRQIKRLLHHTTVGKVDLRVLVSHGDAAATAMAYGRWQMAVGNSLALLSSVVRLRLDRVEITPDFTDRGDQLWLTTEIKVIPLVALGAALNIAIALLWAAVKLAMAGASTSKPPQKEREQHGKQTPHQ